uniref:Uncharacterized protein n=1 Tax=Arundo donax TaxID=35708 RepID=A0A0A9ETZ2_ARUDO
MQVQYDMPYRVNSSCPQTRKASGRIQAALVPSRAARPAVRT